ncbi:MAG: DUF2905 domain-containing protein [Candidatus Omnitrophica bacterium]|nr:DUF2905 domain-containing protein [Candidatus Omnitrophota bacterium]MBI2174760.1 DUF2905 domain-containing protein [Candidatus Omnitrophota bacterium]MBI3010213.1 DUF2905 domain-containing protein [Candidatus Omnitrophota bacterium]
MTGPVISRILIFTGLILIGIGIVLRLSPNIPWLGKLPGDLSIRRDGFSFYFPLTTCLLLSALASLIFWLGSRFRR